MFILRWGMIKWLKECRKRKLINIYVEINKVENEEIVGRMYIVKIF